MECEQCNGKGYVWGMISGIDGEPEAERDFCPTCDGNGYNCEGCYKPIDNDIECKNEGLCDECSNKAISQRVEERKHPDDNA